jgi:N-methylhydantoinase B
MPVFHGEALCGFSLSRVHWPDIGGIAAGSSSVCDEIFKEGLRIPPLKVIEGGRTRADILSLILANVRVPEDRHGDFRAQVAGARRTERRIQELAERYSVDTLADVMEASQVYSERILRRRLAKLPDAIVEHEEQLDGDGLDRRFVQSSASVLKKRAAASGLISPAVRPGFAGRSMPRLR